MKYQAFSSKNPDDYVCGFEYDGLIMVGDTMAVGNRYFTVDRKTHNIEKYATQTQQACGGTNSCVMLVSPRA